jgi:hypothetical protein
MEIDLRVDLQYRRGTNHRAAVWVSKTESRVSVQNKEERIQYSRSSSMAAYIQRKLMVSYWIHKG